MKKHINIFIMLVIALSGLSLTGCNNGDELSTDQYGNSISLNSFGPCPVLRGGTLYFYGSNLDQISEIDLPGADPITQFEVIQSGVPSQISITVPAEKCDTGIVVIKTVKGGVIRTVTPVTYREDIKLTEFYVGSEKNYTGSVGDVVTIKGDYLNLMHGIIFADKDTVREAKFLSHDRYTITVAIPAEAKTGKFKLTDLAAQPTEMETTEALVINLPEVKAITPDYLKAGSTLAISGTSLDQIETVKFKGATVAAANFASQSATSITLALPATATDGEVTLITKSGVEISAGSITTVVPTQLAVSPNPVKNGAMLTITGKDLDLVTSVTFPNVATAVAPKTLSETSLTVEVPALAQAGDITLTLANGKTVTVAYTLVAPVVTECTPAIVTGGNPVIIKGTDLDLVESITFPGDGELKVTAFTAQTANAIALTVPAAAYGTGFTLNLKNGTTVASTALTINAASDPAVNETSYTGTIGEYVTVAGKNFNNVEAVYIGAVKVSKFSERTNTSMTFQVPSTVEAGTYDFIMVGPDGTKYTVGKFVAESPEKDLANFALNEPRTTKVSWPFNFSWSDGNGKMRIMKADLIAMGVKEGSKLIIYKTAANKGQIQINDANWGGIVTVADWNGDQAVMTQVFDANMMKAITTTSDGWSNTAFILQGDLQGVTKMTIMP